MSLTLNHPPPSGSDAAALVVAGEVDLATAQQFADALGALTGAEQSGDVVVDVADVSYFDSSGLRVLAQASRELAGSGRALVLRRPPEHLVRLLRVTALDTVVQLREEA